MIPSNLPTSISGLEPSLSNAQMQGERLSNQSAKEKDPALHEAFTDFVGQTFFGQLIASMRSTQGETAYFNGGQAEKIFQGQLDQKLAEYMSDASASKIADPMFELFQLRQR